ncbi:hypothetical protein EP7_005625 (plasmid) [Isosphaeraceae bacterium EP7]
MASSTLTTDRTDASSRWITASAFAQEIGISPTIAMKFLKRSEASGQLRPCRVGRRPLWDREATLKLAAECGAFVPAFAE